jgi:hypothetical protein
MSMPYSAEPSVRNLYHLNNHLDEGICQFCADIIEVFNVGSGLAVLVPKAMAVRPAVVVGGADEDVLWRDTWYLLANSVAKHTRKSEKISAANCNASVVLFKNERTHYQLSQSAGPY